MKLTYFVVPCCMVFLTALPAMSGTVAVMPSTATSQNWFWWDDRHDQFTANTTTIAQTPPGSLVGSVDMSLVTANDKLLVFTTQFDGIALSALTALSYESLSVSGSSGSALLSPVLQIGIGLTATDPTYRGRLVYSPLFNGLSASGSGWDTWNPLTATSGWFFSQTTPADRLHFLGNSSETCTAFNPDKNTGTCTLAAILLRNPTLSINLSGGVLGFETGGSGVVEKSYADMLTVGVSGSNTTFDFTAPEPATWSLLLGAAGLLMLGRKRVVRRN